MMAQHRKNRLRLISYDYNSNGCYFITICTHHMERTLGTCVRARHDSPGITLSPLGVMVDNVIRSIPQVFSYASIDKYIIMPNHIHLIVTLSDDHAMIGASHASPVRSQSKYAKIVGYLKAVSSKEYHRTFQSDATIWHRGSYDHIIRNESDYQRIWQYIDTNPLHWEEDCYYKG